MHALKLTFVYIHNSDARIMLTSSTMSRQHNTHTYAHIHTHAFQGRKILHAPYSPPEHHLHSEHRTTKGHRINSSTDSHAASNFNNNHYPKHSNGSSGYNPSGGALMHQPIEPHMLNSHSNKTPGTLFFDAPGSGSRAGISPWSSFVCRDNVSGGGSHVQNISSNDSNYHTHKLDPSRSRDVLMEHSLHLHNQWSSSSTNKSNKLNPSHSRHALSAHGRRVHGESSHKHDANQDHHASPVHTQHSQTESPHKQQSMHDAGHSSILGSHDADMDNDICEYMHTHNEGAQRDPCCSIQNAVKARYLTSGDCLSAHSESEHNNKNLLAGPDSRLQNGACDPRANSESVHNNKNTAVESSNCVVNGSFDPGHDSCNNTNVNNYSTYSIIGTQCVPGNGKSYNTSYVTKHIANNNNNSSYSPSYNPNNNPNNNNNNTTVGSLDSIRGIQIKCVPPMTRTNAPKVILKTTLTVNTNINGSASAKTFEHPQSNSSSALRDSNSEISLSKDADSTSGNRTLAGSESESDNHSPTCKPILANSANSEQHAARVQVKEKGATPSPTSIHMRAHIYRDNSGSSDLGVPGPKGASNPESDMYMLGQEKGKSHVKKVASGKSSRYESLNKAVSGSGGDVTAEDVSPRGREESEACKQLLFFGGNTSQQNVAVASMSPSSLRATSPICFGSTVSSLGAAVVCVCVSVCLWVHVSAM
jgi:hypothetical protein